MAQSTRKGVSYNDRLAVQPKTYMSIAVRFFSRDTYTRLTTPSPSPSPLPSPTPFDYGLGSTSRQDKRRASPFEVKLTACVTKRMSLDAFGTPTPPKSEEGHTPEGAMEEVLAEYDSDISEEEEDVDGDNEEQHTTAVTFQHTSLSTIPEGTSSTKDADSNPSRHDVPLFSTPPSPSEMTTPAPGKTPYFTPSSTFPTSSLGSNGLPLPPSRDEPSPFVGRRLGRKHASAPPLTMGVTQRLLEAHLEHSKALKEEVEKGGDVRRVLERQLEDKEQSEFAIPLSQALGFPVPFFTSFSPDNRLVLLHYTRGAVRATFDPIFARPC
jgi:hypothetical protein